MVIDFTNRSAFNVAFLSYGLPNRMIEEVQAWIEEGRRPGGFLWAVICNNFTDAVTFADNENRRRFLEWAQFMHSTYVPGLCWGNEAKANKWLAHGGRSGQETGL